LVGPAKSMRFAYISLLTISVIFLQPARAERDAGTKIGVPSLGWVFDRQSASMRPILGTLGAAMLGPAIDAGFPIASAVIDSQRGFAIAVSAEDHRIRVVRLGTSANTTVLVDGAEASPDRMILSPAGSAAMLYSVKAGRIQVVTGLPDAPVISREISTTGLVGEVLDLAISDDGQRSLLGVEYEDAGSLWMAEENTGLYAVPLSGSPGAMGFLPNSHDAVVVTRAGELYRIDGSSTNAYGALPGDGMGAPVGIQLSRDGKHTYIAYSNGSIFDVDSSTGSVSTTSCGCRATGLDAVNSLAATFRINEPSTSPLLLVNVSGDVPRVWFVPPDRTTSVSERGQQ
jgi:hypothetical protein